MNKKTLALIILLFFAFQPFTYSHNPFLKSKDAETSNDSAKKAVRAISYPPFIQGILLKTNEIQKELNKQITDLIEEIKNNSKKAFFLILLVSFLYGVIHALGPGHGKIVVSSYFLINNSRVIEGALTGLIIAFIHASSAVIITSSLYYLIKSAILLNFENINLVMQRISFSLIVAIGLFLVIKTFYLILNKKRSDSSGLDSNVNHQHINNKKNIIFLALTIGIVPCPGASMILLFTLNYNLFSVGLLSVIFMSAGMALTISLFAVFTILFREYSSRFAARKAGAGKIFSLTAQVIGGFSMLLIGLILLLSVI